MNDTIIITSMENKPLQLETMIKKNIDLSKINLYRPEYEFVTPVGRLDILAEDEDFNPVVVEVKIGTAGDSALGQIFGYMQSVNASRGVILANGFTKRLVLSARHLNIELIQYELDIKISGESVKKEYADQLYAEETTDERSTRLFMIEVGKLRVADNKEMFVQNPDAAYIEDNVLLVKSATVVDIAKRMKLPYTLGKLRIVLNNCVLKSTEQRMFLNKRISVWFFKKPITGMMEDAVY